MVHIESTNATYLGGERGDCPKQKILFSSSISCFAALKSRSSRFVSHIFQYYIIFQTITRIYWYGSCIYGYGSLIYWYGSLFKSGHTAMKKMRNLKKYTRVICTLTWKMEIHFPPSSLSEQMEFNRAIQQI